MPCTLFWMLRRPVWMRRAVTSMGVRRTNPRQLQSGAIAVDDAVGECPDAVDLDVDLVAVVQRFGAAG